MPVPASVQSFVESASLAELEEARRLLERKRRELFPRAARLVLYQLSFRLFVPAPPRGPLREWDLVQCRLGCTLPAGRCVDRQAKAYPSGRCKGASVFPECQECAPGAAYRARLRGYVPPSDTSAPQVLSNAQRAARERWRKSRPETE